MEILLVFVMFAVWFLGGWATWRFIGYDLDRVHKRFEEIEREWQAESSSKPPPPAPQPRSRPAPALPSPPPPPRPRQQVGHVRTRAGAIEPRSR